MLEEDLAPQEISPVKVIKAFSKVVEQFAKAAESVSLFQGELANAVRNDESKLTCSKKSRDYPRKKKPRRCGAPDIELATAEQLQQLKQLNV